MIKKAPVVALVGFILILVLVTYQATFVSVSLKYRKPANGSSPLGNYDSSAFDEVVKYYTNSYLNEVDLDAMEEYAIRSYVAASEDRWGQYYNAEEYKKLIASEQGSASGIGIVFLNRLFTDEGRGYIQIQWVFKDSPADEAGIVPDDRIVAVAGVPIDENNFADTIINLRGEIGTDVTVTVSHNGTDKTLTMTRSEYTVNTVLYHMCDDGITGIIDITGFDQNTKTEFDAARKALGEAGAKQLVFDVRSNPGGLLDSVASILDELLPEGKLYSIVYKDGKEIVTNSDATEESLPMAVLIGPDTASAAELFAAALRDYDKAILVGTTTFGKGVAQAIYRLSDGGAIKLTVSYYNPPCGVNYHEVGVEPDITIEPLQNVNLYTLPDADDPQLAAALEALAKSGK